MSIVSSPKDIKIDDVLITKNIVAILHRTTDDACSGCALNRAIRGEKLVECERIGAATSCPWNAKYSVADMTEEIEDARNLLALKGEL